MRNDSCGSPGGSRCFRAPRSRWRFLASIWWATLSTTFWIRGRRARRKQALRESTDGGDARRRRAVLDERDPSLVGRDHSIVVGYDGRDRQTVAGRDRRTLRSEEHTS